MADMADREPSFARNTDAAAYYERGAAEYDDWYLGVGQYAEYDHPEYHAEVSRLVAMVSALTPARTLDVACGSGFLSRHVRGATVGLDRSPSMARLARSRIPGSMVVLGDALRVPFADRSFERVLTGHFYGHLGPRRAGSVPFGSLAHCGRVRRGGRRRASGNSSPSSGRNACSTTAVGTGSTSDTSPLSSLRTRSTARL